MLSASVYISQPIVTCCLSTGAGTIQGSVFKAALACLEEVSSRTRACGRMLLVELHRKIMEPATFQGFLDKLHNQSQYMKVTEVITPFQFCKWHEACSRDAR